MNYNEALFWIALGQSVVLIITLFVIRLLTNKQVKAIDKSTSKQINKLDENSRKERQVSERATTKTIGRLTRIINESKRTNKNMQQTVNGLTDLKKSFDISVQRMDFLCDILKKQIEVSPDLLIYEDDFKGNILLNKESDYKIELRVLNRGKIPAQSVVVTLIIHNEIGLLELGRGTRRGNITMTSHTHAEFQFGDEVIPSGVWKGTFLKVHPNKVGAYKIRWEVQCIDCETKKGEFAVKII